MIICNKQPFINAIFHMRAAGKKTLACKATSSHEKSARNIKGKKEPEKSVKTQNCWSARFRISTVESTAF
jgi:hypothetical protein